MSAGSNEAGATPGPTCGERSGQNRPAVVDYGQGQPIVAGREGNQSLPFQRDSRPMGFGKEGALACYERREELVYV
jgi:hypothetical protein